MGYVCLPVPEVYFRYIDDLTVASEIEFLTIALVGDEY